MDGSLTAGEVLLVRKYEQETVLHLPVAQYARQLLPSFVYPLPVLRGRRQEESAKVGASRGRSDLRVDHEDQTLGPGVVVPPERTNLVLTTDIPNVELDVLVRYRLNVEANCDAGSAQFRSSSGADAAVAPVGMVVTLWLSLSL